LFDTLHFEDVTNYTAYRDRELLVIS